MKKFLKHTLLLAITILPFGLVLTLFGFAATYLMECKTITALIFAIVGFLVLSLTLYIQNNSEESKFIESLYE